LPHSAARIAAARLRCNELLVARIRVKAAAVKEDIAKNLVVDFETSELERGQLDNLVEDH
jgi:hypothetical protein